MWGHRPAQVLYVHQASAGLLLCPAIDAIK
jgi:hypothetical protein